MAIKPRFFYGLLSIFIILFAGCNKEQSNKIPNMYVTLASNDSKPMGGKIFRDMCKLVFEDYSFETNTKSFNDWYENLKEKNLQTDHNAYIILTPNLSTRPSESEAMKDFVNNGNTLFIATENIQEDFEEIFGCTITKVQSLPFINIDSLKDTYKFIPDTLDYYSSEHYKTIAGSYGFFYNTLDAFIDSTKYKLQQTISLNTNQQPDGIQIKIGEGKLILITNATAFSNYFLLTKNNYEYALGMVSYISPEPSQIVYDEFYARNQMRQPEDSSALSIILSIPPLKWALWLALILCVFAILTNLVRKQRMIPVQIPNKNTTVEFTQTIARLYFNKKDNRNIALKMIQYFTEYIRNKYYIPAQSLEENYAKILAGKTGQPIGAVERVVRQMADIQNGAEVTDEMLLNLNREINQLLGLDKRI